MSPNPTARKKRLPIYLYYLFVTAGLALCVLAFALLYRGGGAQRLLDDPPQADGVANTPDGNTLFFGE